MERVYIKCDPKNNLPNHSYVIHNQREKEFKELRNSVNAIYDSKKSPTKEKDLKKVHILPVYMVYEYCYMSRYTGRI